ncbi:caspase-3-like [Lineus longissimus]|uniref:caspase-3-like n=1 Tax=Lineus longissimus TaxID=88925 RepID=UPI002B4CDD20
MEGKKVTVDAQKHLEAKEVPKRKVDPLVHNLNINYDFSHPRRGLAVVINMRYFDFRSTHQKEREGTDEDAQAIVERLLRLGFDVRRYDDLTRRDISLLMDDLAKEDHSDADCFVCVFLSHGKEGRVYAYDGTVYIETLLANFKGDVCPALAGKPKLFFIQACRGSRFMHGVVVADSYEDGEDVTDAAAETTRNIPTEADFLISYSTVPGYFSWRNNEDGSWFIQALCRVIDDVGTTAELMQMMTYVNRIVAYEFASCTDHEWTDNMKQIPAIETRLTKFVYFHPKKVTSNSLEHYPSRFFPRS